VHAVIEREPLRVAHEAYAMATKRLEEAPLIPLEATPRGGLWCPRGHELIAARLLMFAGHTDFDELENGSASAGSGVVDHRCRTDSAMLRGALTRSSAVSRSARTAARTPRSCAALPRVGPACTTSATTATDASPPAGFLRERG
jgi:hypothetical protein